MGVVLSHRPPSIAHAEAARAGRRSGGLAIGRSVGGCAVSRCAAWLVGGVRGRLVGCVVGWCRAWGRVVRPLSASQNVSRKMDQTFWT